jgi:hypothetical protein
MDERFLPAQRRLWANARRPQMHVSRVLRPALAQMREQLAP